MTTGTFTPQTDNSLLYLEAFSTKISAMKTDPLQKSESVPIEIYKEIMRDIEFMQPYLEDPDIFNPESDKLKNFLIQSFCYLHPDFHYLSYLNNEDIDLEIIKAAGILQIFPTSNISKRNKLFAEMSKDDIHKFWLKLFSLFKKQNKFTTDSIFNASCINKINFFKDMNSTLNYINYQFPVVSGKKINDLIISKEINNWRDFKNDIIITPDESEDLILDETQTTEVDFDNFITDLHQVVVMFNKKKLISQESKSKHIDFFTNFIKLTKNILCYKNDLIVINSKFLHDHNFKLLANNEMVSENLCFIKRCISILKTLKSELKTLN